MLLGMASHMDEGAELTARGKVSGPLSWHM